MLLECFLLLVTAVALASEAATDGGSVNPDLSSAWRILDSVQRMTDYYGTHFSQINLDGIYGLRVMQGQLEYFKEFDFPNDKTIKSKIGSLYVQVTEIADKSLVTLKELDSEYLNKMEFLVNSPQLIGKPTKYRRISASYLWNISVPILDREFYTEKESDNCVALLTDECGISDNCLRIMFSEGAVGYTLTHQLLYTVMIQRFSCVDKIERRLSRTSFSSHSVADHQVALCSNNFFEVSNHVISRDGVIDDSYQDLFLEQLFVCPVLGFVEFLHRDWSDQAITWQSEDGCFRDAHVDLQDYQATIRGRTILKERELSDGCLSHKMAVAFAMFSQSLHFALIPAPLSIGKSLRFDGINFLKEPHEILFKNSEYNNPVQVNPVAFEFKTSISLTGYIFGILIVVLIYKLFKYIKRNRIVITYQKTNHLI